MAKISAGTLLYRLHEGAIEVFLVHPGGPFWASKDEGAWSVPKGLPEDAEELLDAALREWVEETGFDTPESEPISLGSIRQKGGKTVHAWAFEGDVDPDDLASDSFEIEWPPRSGRRQSFPEVDRAGWFDLQTASRKLNPAQIAFLDRLRDRIEGG